MKAVRFFLQILILGVVGCYIISGQTTPTTSNSNISNKAISDIKGGNDEERYRIGYQDTLDIQVFRHPELGQRVGLNPDGTISLFRASGPIPAVCKTEVELAAAIEKEYVSFLKKPEIRVYAVEKKSQAYGVIGAVDKPANYYGVRRIRLLELLSMAGGPSKEAGTRLTVTRTGSTSACKVENSDTIDGGNIVLMNFKVKDVLEGKQNMWMQPGDIVSVLDSDFVYVYGNVNRVGPIKMTESLTLTQAIVSAEGMKPTAKSQVKVLRQKDGSEDREELTFNVKDIQNRKIQDPVLLPNDIVSASEDSTKAVLGTIRKVFEQGLPTIFYRIP